MLDERLSKQIEQTARARGLEVAPDIVAEAVRRVLTSLSEGTEQTGRTTGSPNKLDATRDFPLVSKRPDLVRSATGLSLDEMTLDKAVSGQIAFEDLRIRPETLEYQAQIAESARRPRLAANLRRAGEMTRIPDQRVLEMYNALRPYRCTKKELLDMAEELESKYQAIVCAALVREAAQEYERRGRLKK